MALPGSNVYSVLYKPSSRLKNEDHETILLKTKPTIIYVWHARIKLLWFNALFYLLPLTYTAHLTEQYFILTVGTAKSRP